EVAVTSGRHATLPPSCPHQVRIRIRPAPALWQRSRARYRQPTLPPRSETGRRLRRLRPAQSPRLLLACPRLWAQLRTSASRLPHRPERQRVAEFFDGRDRVFPVVSSRAVQHVERARGEDAGEALPAGLALVAEAQAAGRAKRDRNHLAELRPVAVPA